MELRRMTTSAEIEQMNKYGHLVEENEDWYKALVEEARAIVSESIARSRWTLVEGYWLLGKRIREDTSKWQQGKALEVLQRLQKDTGIGQRTLYYATQFYDKYPDINTLPEGNNISWKKIITKYLPGNEAKVLPDTFSKEKIEDNLKIYIDKARTSKLLRITFEYEGEKWTLSKVQQKIISENGPLINELMELFAPINPSYEQLFKIAAQRQALDRLITKHTSEKIRDLLTALPSVVSEKYAPRITTPLQLETKLGELLMFVKQKGNNGQNIDLRNL